MIYSYKELKLNAKQIKKKLELKELYKIEDGIYSDFKFFNKIEYIQKKYSNSIFNFESAFYYHDLTDFIPNKYYISTKRNYKKIEDNSIVQNFSANHLFELGKIEMEYQNIKIRIYNKERMLIELIKNKNKISYDYYKEIILNYRKIATKLDIVLIEKYIQNFRNGNKIFEIINREVF